MFCTNYVNSLYNKKLWQNHFSVSFGVDTTQSVNELSIKCLQTLSLHLCSCFSFFDGVVHLPFYITLVFRDKFEPNVGCSTGEIMRKWANDKKQICATYDASQCKHLEAFSHDGCARNRSERNHFKIFRHVRVTFKLGQVHASVISENLY